MGSYTYLMIEDMPLLVSKSSPILDVMFIFRENDKKIFQRKISMRSKIAWVLDDSNEDEEAFEYQCELNLIKERLNLFGVNFENIKNKYQYIKDTFINSNYPLSLENNNHKNTIEKLNKTDFNDYCNYLKYYYENRYNLPLNSNHLYNLFNNEVSHGDKNIFFFGYDIYEILVIFSELLNSGEKVIQDLTELKNSGYYESTDNIVTECEKEIIRPLGLSAKTFIFTEGSSDKNILESSLKVLYPHLFDYFTFVDYQDSNTDGGAPMLTKLVKAFVGSRMPNKIIAIYDSDTAALESLSSLENINLPSNIRVTQYPDFDLLKSYPTIGPSGKTYQNIYYLAASIELYLGIDCITNSATEEFYPVVWKSYNQKLCKYHGEIKNKRDIQNNYNNKLKTLDRSNQDWNGLVEIWKHIFKLTSEMNSQIH